MACLFMYCVSIKNKITQLKDRIASCVHPVDKGNSVNATNFWSAGASVIRAESCISKKMTCGSGNSVFCRFFDTYARASTENVSCWTVYLCIKTPCNIVKILQPFRSYALRRCHNIRIKQFPSGSAMGILPVLTACG